MKLEEVIAKRLRLIHFDGEGCGTYGVNACSNCHGPSPMSASEIGSDLAAEIRKARTVTTVEELDALPKGTAIHIGGHSLVKPPHVEIVPSRGWLERNLPATVLWHPEVDA